MNAQLTKESKNSLNKLLLEYKDMFAWTYKDLENILLELLHGICYHDCTLTTRFIQRTQETTWLSPIVVVPKKNGKLEICVNFRKLNATIMKDPYPLPFTYEVLNVSMMFIPFQKDILDITRYL